VQRKKKRVGKIGPYMRTEKKGGEAPKTEKKRHPSPRPLTMAKKEKKGRQGSTNVQKMMKGKERD